MKIIARLLLIAIRKLKPHNIQFRKHFVCSEDYFQTNRLRYVGLYALALALFEPFGAYLYAASNKQTINYFLSSIIISLCLIMFFFSRRIVYFKADHWGVYIGGKKYSWANIEIESQSRWMQKLVIKHNKTNKCHFVCCDYQELVYAKEGSRSIKKKLNNILVDSQDLKIYSTLLR